MMKVYLLIGVVVFALTVAGKVLWDSRSNSAPDVPVMALTLQTPCDLQQAPCVASDSQGRSIRFSINPPNIPLMQELTVEADTTGLPDAASIRLTVEGVNMFMGYQYADLQAAGAGHFHGKLILPVCTLEKMQWRATLEALTPTATVQATIPFNTVSSTLLPPFNQKLLDK
jgi:hypothetical protein